MVSVSNYLTLLAIFCFTIILADNCGGNCPSGSCDTCHCGYSPSYVDIASACASFGGWSQSCCECIARAESGGNANAQLHNTNDSDDVGLWQINSFNWNSCSGGNAPCDVGVNLACARKVWGWGGNSWKYWSTCGQCGCCSSAEERAKMLAEGKPNAEAQ